MSKKAAERPVRRKVEQPSAVHSIRTKKEPAQFLIDAAMATNIGEYGKAINFLKQGIDQDSFAAYKGIGDICLYRGENNRAIEWFQKAHACRPQSIDILQRMVQTLASLGRQEEAAEHFRCAIEQLDNMDKVRQLIGSMQEMGLIEKSIEILEGLISVKPQRYDIMYELAWLFETTAQLDKAEAWYIENAERAHNYKAYNQLGLICRRTGRISEAVKYFQKTVQLEPLFGGGWDNLAMVLMEFGCIEESIELSRIIVDKTLDVPNLHSNYLLRLHYSQKLDQQLIFDEHKKWGQRYAPISMARPSHSNTVDPNRKLRIGYISPDFKRHVAVCYITVLLDSHNRDAVELYGYGNVERPDEITLNLQNEFDHYRDIWNVNDEDVARIIERDNIDILVDFAGHSRNNRLLVLARKPAPVQVSYIGYADTTGMEAIDYVLTDNIVTPPQLQRFYTEELFCLPNGYCCYRPFEEAPPINPLPALKNGYMTFGAFTNVWRLNSYVLSIWAKLLKHTPNARLILGFKGGGDKTLQLRLLSQFKKNGISPERIDIRGAKPYRLYMTQYNDVDIVLDTFPENGGTTTCDALWMGVPVVSLTGQHQVGRYGQSLLDSIGMASFSTSVPSEYIANAVTLANAPESLAKTRLSLRSKMVESLLCNSKQFARDLEAAYREMWHRWCQLQREGPSHPKRPITQ